MNLVKQWALRAGLSALLGFLFVALVTVFVHLLLVRNGQVTDASLFNWIATTLVPPQSPVWFTMAVYSAIAFVVLSVVASVRRARLSAA